VRRQRPPAIGLDDVAELRALLRRRDIAARRVGLALLGSWSAEDLDVIGARAVLEAAGGSYPSLPGEHGHPAELLAQLLWARPDTVPVADVLRVFVVAGERARRALLHLLALRGDDDGMRALEGIVGCDTPAELLPAPTTPLLDPLLEHPDRERVTGLLITLLARQGWTWHAAGLLAQLETRNPSTATERTAVLAAVTEQVLALVDACNRAALGDPRSGDPARGERESLCTLVVLLDVLDELYPDRALGAMLGSADPRVAALGAARLLVRGAPVAPERLELIARDPMARADLHDGVAGTAAAPVLDELDELGDVAVHEGVLVRWLADVTELGRAPDEIEHVTTVVLATGPTDTSGVAGPSAAASAEPVAEPTGEPLHLYRFRMNAPHWSSARGWMVGVSGAHTYSCYAAEDECDVAGHVRAVLTALADWPDRRADGAA
jgi:hypothetical protein